MSNKTREMLLKGIMLLAELADERVKADTDARRAELQNTSDKVVLNLLLLAASD